MKRLLAALAASLALGATVPALAQEGVAIRDPFIVVASPVAKAAGAFMVIDNHSDIPDRLVSATSDAARAVQMHRSSESAAGVMSMEHVEEGFAVPPHGSHALTRGGDHVMFMGLTRPLSPGDTVHVTLTFEHAGEVTLDLPVVSALVTDDRPGAAATQGGDHGTGHGTMDHGKSGH